MPVLVALALGGIEVGIDLGLEDMGELACKQDKSDKPCLATSRHC
jgi:hypothetical protein